MGETLARTVEAGAVGWTHLGNAVPATVPKFENVILHVLAQPGLCASLIPDGHHLPPHAFRVLANALLHADRLLLTTDAMAGAAANAGDGLHPRRPLRSKSTRDGSARLPRTGPPRRFHAQLRFAASSSPSGWAGIYLEEAWKAFSTRPASLLHLKHGFTEGNPADFCLISPETTPRLLATYHRGKCVYEAP